VSVTRRTTAGGAGPDPVARQRERLSERLAADGRRIAALAATGQPAAPGDVTTGT
jgi:hypothetical protein